MSRVDFDIEIGYFEGEPFIEHDHLEDGDPPGKYVLFTDYDALTKALHTPPEAVEGELVARISGSLDQIKLNAQKLHDGQENESLGAWKYKHLERVIAGCDQITNELAALVPSGVEPVVTCEYCRRGSDCWCPKNKPEPAPDSPVEVGEPCTIEEAFEWLRGKYQTMTLAYPDADKKLIEFPKRVFALIESLTKQLEGHEGLILSALEGAEFGSNASGVWVVLPVRTYHERTSPEFMALLARLKAKGEK